jgi:hypothetical protein
MTNTSKKNKATHTTRPKAAKLETPKRKPPAPPKNESARPAAPIYLTGRYMENSELSVIDFVSRVMPKIDEELVSWHKEDRRTIRDAVIAGLEVAFAESARIEQAKEAPEYDPEIEAHRADYEKLADAIAHMTNLSGESFGPKHDRDLLDIKGWDVDDKNHLINGIDGHLYALWQNLDWYNKRTLCKFYAEMRLHADQLAIERHRDYEEFQQRRGAKRSPLKRKGLGKRWNARQAQTSTLAEAID